MNAVMTWNILFEARHGCLTQELATHPGRHMIRSTNALTGFVRGTRSDGGGSECFAPRYHWPAPFCRSAKTPPQSSNIAHKEAGSSL
eukprot:1463206-Amphidinium_carterae.2